jgi:hypothetical protein
LIAATKHRSLWSRLRHNLGSPFPLRGTVGWHTVSNIILDFCAILQIMLYAIVYLAFFLASGVLIPVTIRLLLGDTNRKWKPVAAGFLALVLLLSLKL